MQTTAEIYLGYCKQGDDLHGCIVKNDDGKINAKQTLENYVKQMQNVVDHIKKINDLIPEDNDVELDGNTHYVWISGSSDIIDNLIKHKLVSMCENENQEESENLWEFEETEGLEESEN